MDKVFIIKGPVVDGEQLYWSNEGGWWDRKSATEFSDSESINFPLEATGKEYVSDVCKSFITIAVYHRQDADLNSLSIAEIISECDEGDMIAGKMRLNIGEHTLTETALHKELLSIGNDGEFFNEP